MRAIRRRLTRTVFNRLMVATCSLVVLLILGVSLVFAYQVREFVFTERNSSLAARGQQMADEIAPYFLLSKSPNPQASNTDSFINSRSDVEHLMTTFSQLVNAELWVSDSSGQVILTSANAKMWLGKSITADPEVAKVWNQMQERHGHHTEQTSSDTYSSFDRKETAFSVIVPIRTGKSEIVGHLVLRSSMQQILSTVYRIWALLITTAVIALCSAVILAYLLSRQITLPLQKMQRVAERLADGNYQERVQVDLASADEISHLVQTFNTAAEQIEKTIEQQKQLEQMRKEFIANVSHEFRAPLSSIQGFLELMIDGKIKTDQQSRCLNLMLNDTQLLARLVKDLLDLSRLEAGQVRLEEQWTDLNELVQQALDRAEPLADEKNIRLEYQMESGVADLPLDQHRIQQVLYNLLENAIRHTEEGGRVQIRVFSISDVQSESEKVIFEVEDTGHGIPEQELPFIWERFYKVDKARTRSVGGTGLGLSIVKQLVELHGGSVEAVSRLGEGTTIRFWLPKRQSIS